MRTIRVAGRGRRRDFADVDSLSVLLLIDSLEAVEIDFVQKAIRIRVPQDFIVSMMTPPDTPGQIFITVAADQEGALGL